MIGRLILATAALAAAATTARAEAPACDGARDLRIRAHLRREAHRAHVWGLGWAIGYGVVGGAQVGLALAEWIPLQEFDRPNEVNLWVGAAKASIGVGSYLVLPLRIPQPGAGDPAEPCGSLAAAERALAEAGRRERNSFLFTVSGAVALNVGGAIYLGVETDAWGLAAQSLGLGLAVSAVNLYTHPRTSWRRGVADEPRVTWRAVALPAGVAIAGTF